MPRYCKLVVEGTFSAPRLLLSCTMVATCYVHLFSWFGHHLFTAYYADQKARGEARPGRQRPVSHDESRRHAQVRPERPPSGPCQRLPEVGAPCRVGPQRGLKRPVQAVSTQAITYRGWPTVGRTHEVGSYSLRRIFRGSGFRFNGPDENEVGLGVACVGIESGTLLATKEEKSEMNPTCIQH